MRYPAAVGFYPFQKEELLSLIEYCFKNGPGIPKERKYNKKLIAGIAPHAGYIYSGRCAAYLYKELYENWDYDTIVILGTNHSGLGEKFSMLVTEDWLTPLGIVKTDKEFGKLLMGYYDVYEDPTPHLYEHSIEVQLPFLQYIATDFKIVPILVQNISIKEAKEFALSLKKVSEELNRKIFVLVSSDFTHHGDIYNYVLFEENIKENVKKLDNLYIEAILELDSQKFEYLINKYNGTVCGRYPILVFIEYSKLFDPNVSKLCYYTSADVIGDESIVVGYSSIISYIKK